MEHFSGGAQSQMLSNHNDNMLYGNDPFQNHFQDHFQDHFQTQYESPIDNNQYYKGGASYENRVNIHNNFVPDRMPSRPPFTPELQQALLQRQFDRSLQTPNKYVYSHGIDPKQINQNPINQSPKNRKQVNRKQSQWMIFRAIDWLINTLVDPIFQIIFAILNFLIGWIF